MFEPISRFVAWLLFVPPEPEAPFGSPGSVRVFRASERYFRYRVAIWLFAQLYATATFAFVVFLFRTIANDPRSPAPVQLLFTVLWPALVGLYVVQLALSLAAQRIEYEMRWYIVTDRSLRIREGLWMVREMTLTFANVQEVSIEQGPIERALGISNLRVRTAGGGSAQAGQGEQGSLHLGVLRGIDNAEEVRDLVLARMKAAKSSGIGDPDDLPAELPRAQTDVLGAARAARHAAGELRDVAERLSA